MGFSGLSVRQLGVATRFIYDFYLFETPDFRLLLLLCI